MSQSASQAAAFYREVAKKRVVWTVRDDDGFPAPKTSDGARAQPFWSSRSRVERIISTVSSYAGFHPFEITWAEFVAKWVPGLSGDGIKVGVNWTGKRATGYDLQPEDVVRNVETVMTRGS